MLSLDSFLFDDDDDRGEKEEIDCRLDIFDHMNKGMAMDCISCVVDRRREKDCKRR